MAKRPAPSAFDTAPVTEIVAKKPSGSKLSSYQVALVEKYNYMRQFVAMGVSVLAGFETSLKEAGSEKMVALSCAIKKRAENFIGTEGTKEVTFVFAKKRSNIDLTAEEVALLQEHDIEPESEATEEVYFIPQKYVTDPVWRAKISAALDTIKDRPADIISKTAASTRSYVGDKTVDAIFAKGDIDIATKLLPVVTSVGLKAKSEAITNMDVLISKVAEIMDMPELRDAMLKAANDPDVALEKKKGGRKAA